MKHLFSLGVHSLFSSAGSQLVVFHSQVGVFVHVAAGHGRRPCGIGQNLAAPLSSLPPPPTPLLGHAPQSLLQFEHDSEPLHVPSLQIAGGGHCPQSIAQVKQVSPISAVHHASPQ